MILVPGRYSLVGFFAILSAAVLVVASPLSLFAQQVARGIVYNDGNANRVYDEGEPGVAGVAVSNQEEVVLTGVDGRYELPVSDDTIIFISKPVGYQVHIDELNIPRFYYIHKPAGSPENLQYPGVEPTGPLPESIDFPLYEYHDSAEFRVLVMADPQPATETEVEHVRDDILSEMMHLHAHFGITLGDIMFDDLSLFDIYNRYVAKLGIPFYNIIGNHDMNFDTPNDELSDETFERVYGPPYYSWNYGDVHFVALDNIEWRGWDEEERGGNYTEGLGEKQLRWLENDLKYVPMDKLVVLCMHAPMRYNNDRIIKDAPRLFEIFEDRPRVLALAGHTHYNSHHSFDQEEGWHGGGHFHQLNAVTGSGSWWSGPRDERGIPIATQRDGSPNGYSLLDFDGARWVPTFKAANAGFDYQMRIYHPGSELSMLAGLPPNRLLINVFDGAPDSKVSYSLDEGDWVAMDFAPQKDPLAIHLYAEDHEWKKDWVRPVVSEHMYQADIGSLQPGVHVLTVRHQDTFGRTFLQSHIFRTEAHPDTMAPQPAGSE